LIEDRTIDASLKRKTTLLLGEVLKLADYALPSTLSAGLQVLPSLMDIPFQDNNVDPDEALQSNTIYQIDRVNRTLHKTSAAAKSTSNFTRARSDSASIIKPAEFGKSKLGVEIEDIQFRTLVAETQVLNTVNYVKWKWDIILDLIEGPLLSPKRVEEVSKSNKWLKRVTGFYRPFKYRFSETRNTKPNQRYVRIGCALVKTLLQTPEGVQYLTECKLFRQVSECVAQLDRTSGLTSMTPMFAADRVAETLTGHYFTLLGALTGTPQGIAMLSRWRVINMLYHIIDLHDRGDLTHLIINSMDYTFDSHLRVLLSKALTSCPKAIRIDATKLLRKYATQDMPGIGQAPGSDVAYWAIRLLVTQLYDPDVEVSEVAVQILQEACNRKQYLEYVVKCRPALDHLGEIGAPLLLRFLSTSLGYKYLDGLDYITQEMDDWFLGRNEKYVTVVEASLSRALSHESERPKSILDEPLQRQHLGLVPPHFYRELTRTKEGCNLLKDSGHFEAFASTIQDFWAEHEDAETILKVKACLWAVGNVGSMELGAPFLEDSNVVDCIIKIVESSEIMTMRGTAFFVLGLISRSLHGLEILAEYGWDAATDQNGLSRGYCLPPKLGTLFSVSILHDKVR
jgi:rapamycin-insensitive companion of mTOR